MGINPPCRFPNNVALSLPYPSLPPSNIAGTPNSQPLQSSVTQSSGLLMAFPTQTKRDLANPHSAKQARIHLSAFQLPESKDEVTVLIGFRHPSFYLCSFVTFSFLYLQLWTVSEESTFEQKMTDCQHFFS